ncbi:UNKNOWN [Stylonychia lemnae]|uniref:Transmembrane protein n=1 Tax=Stylonychia lemnae TaxID=5949 RepID=A0A078AWJ6_STYLE|nr:UNKNOWN [Stylonychia lemnae]|eukprot:CDW85178.1 UNKNOWN [Stylonychia lemnae]
MAIEQVLPMYCPLGLFYDITTANCEKSWCVGPSLSDCLQCINPNNYKDLQTLQCYDQCPQNTLPMVVRNNNFKNNEFRYCRELVYYIDSSNQQTSIELGTIEFPYKQLDDPFREIINQVDLNIHRNVTIYLKQNTSLTLFYIKVSPILVNLNLRILPYTENEDQSQNKTNILSPTIICEEKNYFRTDLTSFNPTLYTNGTIIPYNLQSLVNKGIIDASFLNIVMFKFQMINSGVVIKNINLKDGEIRTYSTISGFFTGYYSPYKWLVLEECSMLLKSHILFTQDGMNLMVKSSFWDISINTLSIFQLGSYDCDDYKDKEIQGNLILDGNTIINVNQAGANPLIYTQMRINMQITNNKFLDMFWRYPDRVLLHEQYSNPCQIDHSVTLVIENNTFEFSQQSLSYVGFLFKFLYQPRFQQTVIFRGNTYINNSFQDSGIIQVFQDNNQNLNIIFENNSFINCSNLKTAQSMIILNAESITLKNNSITGGMLSTGFFLATSKLILENFKFREISKSELSSIQSSLITITGSQNSNVSNLEMSHVDFGQIRALNLIDCQNSDIMTLKIHDSKIDANSLIYLQNPTNLKLTDLIAQNISSNIFSLDCFFIDMSTITVPQIGSNSIYLNQQKLLNSSIQFFRLRTVIYAIQEDFGKMMNLTISNIDVLSNKLAQGQSFFKTESFNAKNLSVQISNILSQNNSVEDGALFYLERRGSIIFAERKHSSCLIINSSLTKNYAISGGVAFIQTGSDLIIRNSTIIDNFAVTGGVIQSVSDGQVSIIDCYISRNTAIIASIFYLFNNVNPALISGGQIERNGIEFSLMDYRNFYLEDYQAFEQILKNLFNQDYIKKLYEMKQEIRVLIKKIQDNQNYQIQVIKATIKFEKGVIIQDQHLLLQAQSQSLVQFDNTTVKNMVGLNQSLLIFDQTEIQIHNFDVQNITTFSALISAQYQSSLSIINLKYQQSQGPLLFLKSSDAILTNLVLRNILYNETEINSMIVVLSIQNSQFTLYNSEFTDLSNLQISGIAIQLYDTDTFINNSTFANLSSQRGSAIEYVNSPSLNRLRSLQVLNSTFINNSALSGEGGAINLIDGNIDLSNSLFDRNFALEKGGAINLQCSLSNLQKNQAKYGNNFGSYPYDLKIQGDQDNNLENLVSGQESTDSFEIGIYDQNDQLIITDSESDALLLSEDYELQVSGQTRVTAKNGIFKFDSLKFIAKPDYTSYIKIKTAAIDDKILQKTTNDSKNSYLTIEVKFRSCLKGEVLQNLKCVTCPRGYYSFDQNSTKCQRCPQGAECKGGTSILLDQGLWRSQAESLIFYQCSNKDACLGGQEPQKCSEGYKGKLCSQCIGIVNETIYAKTGPVECGKCQPLHFQILQLIGILFLIVAYIIMLAKDFELSWPHRVDQILRVFSFVSSSSQNIISFDCFYYQLGAFQIESYYLRIIIYGITPIILSIIGAIIWLLVKLTIKRNDRSFNASRNIQVTCYCIILLLNPIITNNTFSLFSCMKYEDGNYYLRKDMSIQCWNEKHLKMSLTIGVIIMGIWTIGFPIYIFIQLLKIKDSFDNPDNLKMFGLFYVGLNDKTFYWEVIFVNLRKFIIIATGAFVPKQNQSAKILVLFGGLFFVEHEVQKNDQIMTGLFLVILIYNVYFLARWTMNMIVCLMRTHQKRLSKISIIGKYFDSFNNYDQDLKNHIEKLHGSQKMRESVLFQNVENTDMRQTVSNSQKRVIIYDDWTPRSKNPMSAFEKSDNSYMFETKQDKNDKQQPISILKQDKINVNSNRDQRYQNSEISTTNRQLQGRRQSTNNYIDYFQAFGDYSQVPALAKNKLSTLKLERFVEQEQDSKASVSFQLKIKNKKKKVKVNQQNINKFKVFI